MSAKNFSGIREKSLHINSSELPIKKLRKPRRSDTKSSQIKLSSNRASLMIREQEELLQALDSLSENPEERELQRQTYAAIRESLRRGEKSGIIKLPTGTGKTWVFANLLKIFQRNGLILVPRVDLYDSTIRDLREVGFQDSQIHLISEETGANSEERMLSHLTDPSIDWSSGKNVTIMSYQSLNSMFKKNPEIGSFMRSHFDMIIEDEAHRAIGKKTKKAVGVLTEGSEDTMNFIDTTHPEDTKNKVNTTIQDGEDQEEQDLEELDLIEQSELQEELEAEINVDQILGLDDESFKDDDRFNYKFTATPDLLRRSVSDESEYIFYATFEQAVRTRAIVLPQYVNMGSAYLRSGDLETWKVKDIEALSDQEDDQFIDENGLSIRDKIIDAYIEKKQQHNNSLPAVAFAGTIKHAGILVEAMRARGIKAQRVTSAKGDISSKRATEMMDRGELDVIVTVTKVSEGFDYAPLSCAMWFSPVLSPAKITQGNGRIARDAPGKMPEQIEDESGRIIPSPAAYIIAPSEWHSGLKRTGDPEDLEEIHEDTNGGDEDQNPQDQKSKKLSRIGNFYELLVSQGEFDYNTLPAGFQNIISLKETIVCKSGEEKDIDGVIYVGVKHKDTILGVSGQSIFRKLRRRGDIHIILAKSSDSGYIDLVPKDFILGLQSENICSAGEEKEIDGVIHVGVPYSHTKQIMGLPGAYILRNAKGKTEIYEGIQPGKNQSIKLVPKEFILSLIRANSYICLPGQTIKIEDVEYVGVTNAPIDIMGMNSQLIIKNAKKSGIQIFEGKQPKTGFSIQLIPKNFIKQLKKTYKKIYQVGEEVMINRILHVAVTKTDTLVMGIKGSIILGNARNRQIKVVSAKQRVEGAKQYRSIQLVPKYFIEELLRRREFH